MDQFLVLLALSGYLLTLCFDFIPCLLHAHSGSLIKISSNFAFCYLRVKPRIGDFVDNKNMQY